MLNFTQDKNFINPKIDFLLSEIKNDSSGKEKLSKNLSLNYKVHSDELLAFSSKKALLHSFSRYVFSFLDIKNIILYSPIDKYYEDIFSLYEFNIIKVNIYEDLYVDFPSNSLVIFSNPNLLDGKYYELERLFLFWSKKNASILVDETFLDYTNSVSAATYVNIQKNLFVLKFLNKFYSSSLLKLTSLIASNTDIKRLKLFEADDNISFFDISYTNRLLKEKNFKLISKVLNSKNKSILEKILNNKKIFEYFIFSDTNFILVKVLDSQLDKFKDFLKMNSIVLQECSSYDFLNKSYFRIVIKSKEQLNRLSLLLEDF